MGAGPLREVLIGSTPQPQTTSTALSSSDEWYTWGARRRAHTRVSTVRWGIVQPAGEKPSAAKLARAHHVFEAAVIM